ncbi:BQ2448_8128 [Microbotryum intermedium]|uniref:BQ2448_8128 protein n=1 Tax=Microbotryum intermedium TaxID=269621 RepID=A0A238FMJ5_9BASI|nr:BQ2448_8128 [Microbotryum intermedium]
MAQGFKTKAPAKPKTKTTQKKLQNKDPKKGGTSAEEETRMFNDESGHLGFVGRDKARTIPPKKQALVAQAIVHRKNTSSHHTSLEKTIATQAISHGKLTIMRSSADETEEGRKALKK